MAFDMTALPLHPKAGKPAQAYIYRDAAGAPVLIANRYEPLGRGKFFLPFDVIRQDWKAPASRPLYQLDRLTAAAPDDMVLLVEGEKCADALAALGFLAPPHSAGPRHWPRPTSRLWRGVAWRSGRTMMHRAGPMRRRPRRL